MKATTRLPDESSQQTTIFEAGDLAREKTSSPACEIYTFSDFQKVVPAPARTKPLSEIIERWKGDPRKSDALANARRRLVGLNGDGSGGLRALRLRAGLSQSDLAKMLKTSQPHIARIEGGSAEPTLDTCRRLARAFNIDLNAIDRALQVGNGGAD